MTAGYSTRSGTSSSSPESRSEEHTSELQSRPHLVCRLLLEKKNSTSHVMLPQLLGARGRAAEEHTVCIAILLTRTARATQKSVKQYPSGTSCVSCTA